MPAARIDKMEVARGKESLIGVGSRKTWEQRNHPEQERTRYFFEFYRNGEYVSGSSWRVSWGQKRCYFKMKP